MMYLGATVTKRRYSTMEKRFYSPSDVAHMLGVSTSTVLRLIHDGNLPALRVSERIYRIPEPAFERFQSGGAPPEVEISYRRVDKLRRIGQGESRPRLRRLARAAR